MLLVFLRNPAAFARALWSGLSGDDIIERCVSLDEVVRAIEIGLIVQHQVRGPGMAARIKRRYANVHNMARIELCRASIGAATSGSVGLNWWRKLFGPVTPAGRESSAATRGFFAVGAASSLPASLSDLAAVVNKTTGMINYAGLGYSEAHEKMEDRLVIPRYLRCVLGLMTDALQGRIRGNEARRVIATAAATVLAPTVYLLS